MSLRNRITYTLLSVLLALSALSACSTDQLSNTAALAVQARLADHVMQSGAPAETILAGRLSETEAQRVLDALDAYAAVRARWADASGSIAGAADAMAHLQLDYAVLADEYRAVREIVQQHWSDYSRPQQEQLRAYHDRALSIDAAMQQALQERQRIEAVGNLLALGSLIADSAAL